MEDPRAPRLARRRPLTGHRRRRRGQLGRLPPVQDGPGRLRRRVRPEHHRHALPAFLYLATVIDLASRRLADWAIADHRRTDLVTGALAAAGRTRGRLAVPSPTRRHATQHQLTWPKPHSPCPRFRVKAQGRVVSVIAGHASELKDFRRRETELVGTGSRPRQLVPKELRCPVIVSCGRRPVRSWASGGADGSRAV